MEVALSPFGIAGHGSWLVSRCERTTIRQSASESCGPETNVPLTFVEYQPDTTPSRSDSSVLTWRGERFCISRLSVERPIPASNEDCLGSPAEGDYLCASGLAGEPGKVRH